MKETSEETALRLAATGPQAYCDKLQKEIRRNHLLTGHDPDGRPPRLERLVAYITDHLFEANLSVKSACQAVGIADTGIAVDLRAYTRYTVDQLIARLRIEAAVHLLVYTQIKVSRIADLLGFKSYATFLRTYRHWTGETAEVTRRHKVESFANFDFGSFRHLLRMGSGDLAPDEARILQEGLGALYTEVFGTALKEPRGATPALVIPRLDVEGLERFHAAEVWAKLAELPFAEQRELVRAWTFWTSATFKYLQQKARIEGRRNKKLGVQVARLTLDCLDGNEERLGPRFHELQLEGWSWLGNAQRLACDLSGADNSFRHAEGILEAYDLRQEWPAGLFYLAKGTLRMFERSHDEALDLFDQALPPLETAGDVHFQVKTLLQRTAALLYANRFEEVEPTLRKATVLLQEAPDEKLSFWVAYWLTFSLVRANDFHRADTYFEKMFHETVEIEEPIRRTQIEWTGALIDHGLGRIDAAETRYLGCLRSFEALDELQYAALVGLDLCLFYSENDEPARVLEIAPASCKTLETLRLYDETLAALQLLGDAIAKADVTVDVLREVRSSLWQDPFAGSA
jgi:AraC-like DNA-binding protein/tetratricopeptide (TPR) repeat protein